MTTSPAPSLHDMLQSDFGVDLPISGGMGGSRDSPVVVHYRHPNDYVSVEYAVLRCLGIGRGIEWRLLQAAISDHGDRKIEQMKIEAKWTEGDQMITQIENYYFDLTDCYGR